MTDRTFKASESYKLEDPERLKWLPPGEVLEFLELQPGMVVADVGAGTGYFAIPIASKAAAVQAVDSQREMLEKFRLKLEALGGAPGNIHLLEGEAAATGLPSSCCDVVLMANVWHELPDHAAALRETARILRPAGALAILDWRDDVDRPPGPPLEHRIPTAEAARFLAEHGWSVLRSTNVGLYHYMLVARR